MLLFVGDANSSAFEYAVTPLAGGPNFSFLGPRPWNEPSQRNSVRNLPTEQFRKSDNNANNVASTLSQTLVSPSVIVVSDEDRLLPSPTVNSDNSLPRASNSFGSVITMSTDVRMRSDASNFPVVGTRQRPSGCTQHVAKPADSSFVIKKPARGKENVRPSGNQAELSNLDAGNRLDTGPPPQRTKKLESTESAIDWRSPLRLSVGISKDVRSARSQLFPRCSHKDVVDSDVFTALSFAFADSPGQ